MSLIDTPTLRSLTQAVNLTLLRQRLVSENIANIDTPGYRTRDVDFTSELRRAMSEGEAEGAAGQPVLAHVVRGLEELPDGNNVSIDRESLLMAQNQLQFQAEVAVLRSEFSRLQLAINGGSSS